MDWPESAPSSDSGTKSAAMTAVAASPLGRLIGDMVASRDRALAPAFIAQVEAIHRAGVDPVLLAHVVARQFNRQTQARLMAAGTFSNETYEQEAESGAQEWITRLLGNTTYTQWLAEKNGAAPPATLTPGFAQDLTDRLRTLQTNGADEVLLVQIINSQNSRLDSVKNWELRLNASEILGQNADNRFYTQEYFRPKAALMQSLTSEQLAAYATLYQGYQEQVRVLWQERIGGGRAQDNYEAEVQRLLQDYTSRKQQLLGPDRAGSLP